MCHSCVGGNFKNKNIIVIFYYISQTEEICDQIPLLCFNPVCHIKLSLEVEAD